MAFLLACLAVGVCVALILFQWQVLGTHPSGARLERIQKSPNYKDGIFVNIEPTVVMREGASTLEVTKKFFFSSEPELSPKYPLPVVETNLSQMKDDVPTLIWFGHSSYLIKYKGKNILVDPVLSGYASPVSFLVRSFPGTDFYNAQKMPAIDLLVISHDHYDHLDFETLKELKGRIAHAVVPLGVGAHLDRWDFSPEQVTELDWWESKNLQSDFEITATPARHFSGRAIQRGKSLWASYVLRLGDYKIFIGGDSGYDPQFKKIGARLGPIDLAMLECGQYNPDWPSIHMFPEESAQAGQDLQAKQVMAVHWGKFVLAYHSWKEPIQRFIVMAEKLGLSYVAPRIGEPVTLGMPLQNQAWWMEDQTIQETKR